MKRKLKKSCCLGAHLLLLAAILSACAKQDKEISMARLQEEIARQVPLEAAVVVDLKSNLESAERYGLPPDKIEEGFVYTNDDGLNLADEIIVLKAAKTKDVKELERALEAEISGLSTTYDGGDEKEFGKVQQHILKSKGRYVILAIAEEGEKAEAVFNRFFEEPAS